MVRRIEPDGGFADVVAGTGYRGGNFDDDTGAATSIPLGWPTGLAMGPDGSLYIADRGRHMIFRLKDGQITRFAGTGRADFLGPSGYSPEGRPARDQPLYSPCGVAVAPDGTVYIADTLNSRIRRVDTGRQHLHHRRHRGLRLQRRRQVRAPAPSSSSPPRSRWGRTGRSTSPTPATP